MTHPELLINSVPKPKGVPSKHLLRVASVVIFVVVLLVWLFTSDGEPLKAADVVARDLAATLTPVERARVDQNHQLIEEAFKASGLPSELPLFALTGADEPSFARNAPWSKSAILPPSSQSHGVMREASKAQGLDSKQAARVGNAVQAPLSSSAPPSLPSGPMPTAHQTLGLDLNNAVTVAQESEVMNSKIVVVDFDDLRGKKDLSNAPDLLRMGPSVFNGLSASALQTPSMPSARETHLKNLSASLRELDQGMRVNQRMDNSPSAPSGSNAPSAAPLSESTPGLEAMMQAFGKDTAQAKTSSPRAQDTEFLKEASAISTLKASLKPVRLESVHALLEGTVIPAVLTRDIVSDLPGTLTAQVTQTVYDSITSKTALICKGAKLIGRYSNDIRTGQSRLLFAFTRLILLNGQSFNLTGFEGSDALGQAGIGGEVDNHFLKIYGASLAIGALSDQVTRQQAVPQGAFASSSATGQIMVQTTREILQRGRESAPTITVARGSLINVEVRQDLVFHAGSLQRCV